MEGGTWVTVVLDYFLDLVLGVESAHDKFCSAKKVHSSLQKGSLLKISNSCLCLKNIRVLQIAQLAIYLDGKLLFVLPLPEPSLAVLPGVGLAMNRPCVAMYREVS